MPVDGLDPVRKRALELLNPPTSSSSSSTSSTSDLPPPTPTSPSASSSLAPLRSSPSTGTLHTGSYHSSPLSSPSKRLKRKKQGSSKFANDPSLFHPPATSSSSPSSLLRPPPSSPAGSTAAADGPSSPPFENGVGRKKQRHAIAVPDGAGIDDAAASASASIDKLLANVDPRIVETRKNLPIWAGKEAIVEAVRQNDTVVILGETGSGKTTQIPQFLFEAGFTHSRPVQMIGVTQPRRVAATSLARRVAVEMGCPDPAGRAPQNHGSGKDKANQFGPAWVGYSIRFEDRTSKRTRIKFMTDGMVLREMIGDGDYSRLPGTDDADPDRPKGRGKAVPVSRSVPPSSSLATEAEASTPIGARPRASSTLLSRYSVLIIDEAHERTLRTDLVLGLAKRIQRERKALRADWIQRGRPAGEAETTKLKIVVMSATLDAESFASFFGSPSAALGRSPLLKDDRSRSKRINGRSDVPILYVKGRQHAVTMFHTEEPSQEWIDAALRTVLQIHVTRPPGDVLVFLTGQEEIETLSKSLETYAKELPTWAEHESKPPPLDLMIAPLYAALGPSASVKVFATTPPRTRKVVLATNIAETSITIPGITYVVDCGLAKEKVYSPTTGVESLQVQEVSQSAARQRAGRAGRERSGECYRLYTQEAFRSLLPTTTPEILRTDLGAAVLQLCAMGQDPYNFDWMDQPDSRGLRDAIILLIQLGALEIASKPSQTPSIEGEAAAQAAPSAPAAQLVLTAIGKKMAMLPVAPAYARALVAASRRSPKVARQVRDMIAVLSADRSVLLDPSDPEKRDEGNRAKAVFVHPSGDHGTLLNVLYAYLAEQDAARRIYRAKARGIAEGGTRQARDAVAAVEAREHVKAWCQNHFVHERAIKNVLHIRKQLGHICSQQGIVCDDTLAMQERTLRLKAKKDGDHDDSAPAADQDDDEDRDDDGGDGDSDTDDDNHDEDDAPSRDVDGSNGLARLRQLKEGLFVTRKDLRDTDASERAGDDDEDYVELRKCMLEGRFSNAALRTPEGTWKRTGGGQPFRLHPSSTLHALRRGNGGHPHPAAAASGQMEALLVEEVIVTSQTFARTCSLIEPAWLQELMQANPKPK